VQELIDQIPALIGVIIGVAATYITTRAGARAQWKREQDVRSEDRRLDAYVAYTEATSRVYELCLRLGRSRGLPTGSGSMPLDIGLDQLTQAATDRTRSWYRLQLVGDSATVAAGREWLHAMWDVEKFAIGDLDDTTEWRKALDEARRMRSAFHQTARESLGTLDRVAVATDAI
jgi:hypothetical protein